MSLEGKVCGNLACADVFKVLIDPFVVGVVGGQVVGGVVVDIRLVTGAKIQIETDAMAGCDGFGSMEDTHELGQGAGADAVRDEYEVGQRVARVDFVEAYAIRLAGRRE
ncbi:hypothetical protein [Amycolatopsis speibonae]|uniref:Uncharacterized protein n=1 Tax=Amycolatopsis speibonae TaxID=1450224 RepID=A0ABV7PC65_9PSEU